MCVTDKQTDGQTDRQTDRQTDGQTDGNGRLICSYSKGHKRSRKHKSRESADGLGYAREVKMRKLKHLLWKFNSLQTSYYQRRSGVAFHFSPTNLVRLLSTTCRKPIQYPKKCGKNPINHLLPPTPLPEPITSQIKR